MDRRDTEYRPLRRRSILGREGFSPLELVMVLAIAAIAATVVVPAVLDHTRSHSVAEQARRVHTKMAKLRARAVAEQREYQIELVDGTEVRINQKDDLQERWNAVDGAETLRGATSVTLNGSSNGAITFSPNGRVSQAGTLVIGEEHSEHTIRILASGMVRWESRRIENTSQSDTGIQDNTNVR